MRTRDPRVQARADHNDLVVVVALGSLAVALLMYSGIRRIADLFASPGALTVEMPIPSQPITAQIGTGADALVTDAVVIVSGVNTVSIACLVLGIVINTLGLTGATVVAVLACRRLISGIIFDTVNVRLMYAISMCLLVAGVGQYSLSIMGLNGVYEALDAEFSDHVQLIFAEVPTFAAAVATGVLPIVFRNGAVLRNETEGLV
jgi:hypothetical protein